MNHRRKRTRLAAAAMLSCFLLTVPAAHAAGSSGTNTQGVTYSASVDRVIDNGDGQTQTVVVTVRTNKPVELASLGGTVLIPEGFTLTTMENTGLGLGSQHFNTENGRVAYYSPNAENMVTDQLVTIYYTAPADLAHGSYDLGMEIDSISKDYGMVVWEKDATAGTALIVGQETSQPDPKPEDKEEGEKAPIVPTDPEVPKVPITPTQPGKPSAIAFKDVAADAYYYAPVTWAVENGITSGTSADTFSPNAPCTRAQAVVFLWRAAGCPQPMSSHMPFTDVAYGSYYHDAVLWAVENGITSGTSATTFSPDMTCTRGQIVTFLWRAQGEPQGSGNNPFGDVADSAYYHGPVLWAVEQGITSGTAANAFSPDMSCTRGQIVTFLYRNAAR